MEKTWKPTTAGILCIITGALQLIFGLAMATIGGIGGALIGMGWLSAIGAPLIVLGIIVIVGGIYALRRKVWGLALAGSISTFFPTIFLGILAITLIALSKKEFEPQLSI